MSKKMSVNIQVSSVSEIELTTETGGMVSMEFRGLATQSPNELKVTLDVGDIEGLIDGLGLIRRQWKNW